MGWTDYGFIQLGSFLKGDGPSYPDYVEFGTGSRLFTGSYNYLEDGILRKQITWRWAGNNAQATAVLLTTDGNGSNFNEIGMGTGSLVGSNVFTRDLSAIGDKNNSFSVTTTFETRFSRP